MRTPLPGLRTVLVAVDRALPGSGTNGYISDWGAKLAGVAPRLTAA